MRRFNIVGLLIISIIVLVGCGGGSGDDDPIEPKDKKGFYVDSAVEGVEYQCGTHSGTTGVDGEFSFEEGEGCRFSIAGVPLREVPADRLEDNVIIFENNVTTARFLQSIDRDGNVSNGIEISSLVRGAIEEGHYTEVPVGEGLGYVVLSLGAADGNFTGSIVSELATEMHLIDNVREVLGGTTYYAYDEGEGIATVHTVTFNDVLSGATISQRDYPSGDHPETRNVDIEMITSSRIRLTGDENVTIMVGGSLSTIEMYEYPHGRLLDTLYTSEAAAVAAGD